MSSRITDYEDNAKGKPSLHKNFGGKEYFWCGKYKNKRKGGVILHLTAVAGNTGYRYRIEKTVGISRFTYGKETTYNLWCRRK